MRQAQQTIDELKGKEKGEKKKAKKDARVNAQVYGLELDLSKPPRAEEKGGAKGAQGRGPSRSGDKK